MYKLLIESNLEVQHEETKITLMEGFYPKKWFNTMAAPNIFPSQWIGI